MNRPAVSAFLPLRRPTPFPVKRGPGNLIALTVGAALAAAPPIPARAAEQGAIEGVSVVSIIGHTPAWVWLVLAGLMDFGPQSAPAQSLLHAVAEKGVQNPATAWHCCLEFFSVATRLPPEFRVAPSDAVVLLQEEVFARMHVLDLPATDRVPMLRAAQRDGVAGGRIYDAHIAEVARAGGAEVVVTDNRRHFLSALRYGIRVETPSEFLAGLKGKRR